MRLDLAERLRCPRAHPATPLVVVATAVDARDLRRGFAGCPVCQLEARIVEGDVVFSDSPEATPEDAVPSASHSAEVSTPELDRLIALLGLAEPGGSVLLTGRYARLATDLARAADVVVIVMWADQRLPADEHVASVRGLRTAVPFTDATFRGAAVDLDATGSTAERDVTALSLDAVRSVVVGGRVVGPSSLARPDGLKELARDAVEWVAERQAISAPVALRRR